MFRRLFTFTLAAALVAACDGAGPFAANDTADQDALAALLAEGSGAATRSSGSGPPLFDRLAGEIPGFAGLYRTAPCNVVVMLTAAGDAAQAARVVHAAIEPLVVRACPHGIRVHDASADFGWIELNRYLQSARRLNGIRGVTGMHLDVQANAIVIVVASHQTVEQVIAALPALGIPRAAVVFRSGSSSTRSR